MRTRVFLHQPNPQPDFTAHEINPNVSPFNVAAARVEHSSLRKMLSICVRTVLGLIDSVRATSLLLAPRLISLSTSHSRLVSSELLGCATRCWPLAAAITVSQTWLSKAPRLASCLRIFCASSLLWAGRQGLSFCSAIQALAVARIRCSALSASPDRPR